MTTSRQKRNNVFDCVRSTIGPVLCVILGLALFATMLTAFVTLAGCGSDEIADDDDVVATIETMSHSAPSHQRVVQYGDSLWTIAAEEHVDWLQLAAVNRTYLVATYEVRCSQLRDQYRQRQRGWYCNDSRRDTWANSLKPSDLLQIPEPLPAEAPQEIREMIEIVENAPEPIALVIDDTGSMSDDRQVVMDWYLTIAHARNKRVVGVWLYADGKVEYIDPGGNVSLSTTGGMENTHSALSEAANSRPHPSSILLVTDEQGDDWQWDRVGVLPPVFGHCLPEYRNLYGCEENLQRLARETGGGYIRGAHH